MYKSRGPTSIGESFTFLESLSPAHTRLELAGSRLPDEFTPEQIINPGSQGLFDTGYYKVGSCAVCALIRITGFNVPNNQDESSSNEPKVSLGRGILIARMQRIAAAAGLEDDRVPVDLLYMHTMDDSEYTVTRIEGGSVAGTVSDFADADFFLPRRAIMPPAAEDERYSLLPQNFRYFMQESMSADDSLAEIEDRGTLNLLSSMLDQEPDDRYVTGFVTEREALLGREKATALMATLDDLYAGLEGNFIHGRSRQVVAGNGDTTSAAWQIRLLSGETMVIRKIPHEDQAKQELERDAVITHFVEPPSVLSSAKGVQDHSYSVTIRGPQEDIQHSYYINGEQLTVEHREVLPDLGSDQSELNPFELSNQPDTEQATELQLARSEFIRGRKFLEDADISPLITVVEDSSVALGVMKEIEQLKSLGGPLARSIMASTPTEKKQKLLEFVTKYPDMDTQVIKALTIIANL